jgi:hypothetical protein
VSTIDVQVSPVFISKLAYLHNRVIMRGRMDEFSSANVYADMSDVPGSWITEENEITRLHFCFRDRSKFLHASLNPGIAQNGDTVQAINELYQP